MANKLLHSIVLAVCDPRKAVTGELPTPQQAVTQIIDRMLRAESELAALQAETDEIVRSRTELSNAYVKDVAALEAENQRLREAITLTLEDWDAVQKRGPGALYIPGEITKARLQAALGEKGSK